MKFKVNDLLNRQDKRIEGEIDYSYKLNDEIVDLTLCDVTGSYSYDKVSETFKFSLKVGIDITALSCVSLEPVKLFIDFDTDLFYTFKVADDDSFPIINNIIDLDEEIWGEIILNMPLRVMKDNETFDSSDNIVIEKESPFEALKEDK